VHFRHSFLLTLYQARIVMYLFCETEPEARSGCPIHCRGRHHLPEERNPPALGEQGRDAGQAPVAEDQATDLIPAFSDGKRVQKIVVSL